MPEADQTVGGACFTMATLFICCWAQGEVQRSEVERNWKSDPLPKTEKWHSNNPETFAWTCLRGQSELVCLHINNVHTHMHVCTWMSIWSHSFWIKNRTSKLNYKSWRFLNHKSRSLEYLQVLIKKSVCRQEKMLWWKRWKSCEIKSHAVSRGQGR